jgi:hypothetical protein
MSILQTFIFSSVGRAERRGAFEPHENRPH